MVIRTLELGWISKVVCHRQLTSRHLPVFFFKFLRAEVACVNASTQLISPTTEQPERLPKAYDRDESTQNEQRSTNTDLGG
jgi:hypothetical protein